MAKNILQDIVPPEKRSIRNIPLPNRSTKREPIADIPTKKSTPKEIPTPTTTTPIQNSSKIYSYEEGKFPVSYSSKNKVGIWAGVVGAVLIIVFVIASIFSSATVIISPMVDTVTLSPETIFTAKKNPNAEGLGFEILTLTKSAGKDVPATGEEKVERKSSGAIVVYNNVDTSPQRLIKNTRFETPAGLIYRINESIVVPGKKTENNQTVPGSVEVIVYADEVGEKYNISKTDFTVPGFKDDPVRYKGIYARSKTDMSGGFVGTVKKVGEADQKSASQSLSETLSLELQKEASQQIPEGFVLIPGSELVLYTDLPQSNDTGSSVTINQQGTFRAILIPKKSLARDVATKVAPNLLKNNVDIVNSSGLTLELKDKDILRGEDPETVTFSLNGTVSLMSQFDEVVIKSELAGKGKKELGTIMANFSGVKSAEGIIRPFWKRSFPKDTQKITLKVGEN